MTFEVCMVLQNNLSIVNLYPYVMSVQQTGALYHCALVYIFNMPSLNLPVKIIHHHDDCVMLMMKSRCTGLIDKMGFVYLMQQMIAKVHNFNAVDEGTTATLSL